MDSFQIQIVQYMERKETLIASLFTSAFSEAEVEEAKEVIHHISRAEYKRGKADGIVEALDDNSILHGKDADRFVENMIKAETEPPSEKQIQFMKEIKLEGEAGFFDVTPTEPYPSQRDKKAKSIPLEQDTKTK